MSIGVVQEVDGGGDRVPSRFENALSTQNDLEKTPEGDR